MMTEQMKSQEEEMRQNMEELEAAQEHIERDQRDAKAKETLLESTSIVLQTNQDFVIQSFNDFSEHKLHHDAADFQEMSIEFLFVEYSKIETGIEILKTGSTWIDFVYLKTKHNQKIFTKVIASPIKDEYGDVSKYLFILDDISDAKS
jgi:PAS domain-containing protein